MSQPLQFLILTAAGWLIRQQEHVIEYLHEENRILRELLGEKRIQFSDSQRRRLAVRGKRLGRQVLAGLVGIATPDTILRWHRKLVAQKYDGSGVWSRGRPKTSGEIAGLVIRMAGENPKWGYTRIRGALANLGHQIACNTVRRILSEHGIVPAPERSKRTSWKTFLRAHWERLAATDLFSVEVLTFAGPRRYLVLFAIELKTRRVQIAGICHQPYGAWMEPAARNLTDAFDGFLRDASHLIHDRDPLFTRAFDEILVGAGVTPIKLAPRSPNLNAYAERFVRSIKEECLSRVVVLGEPHLRLLVNE